MNDWWKLWCNALGQKAFKDNKKADKVAWIRTSWVLLNMATCIAIIANCIHQWWGNMKGVPHYKKNGKLYTGKTHKHNGRLMTGAKHTAASEYLTHTKPKVKK